MQKLVFRNANGTEIDLTSGAFGITEWEGFSSVDLNLQTQQVPFYDGSVYLDGLLGEREISVTLAMQDNNNLERRYELRRQLISVLNPKLGEGILIYTNDYISKRIKAVPQVPVFENHNSNDSGTPKASLSWTCPSPYWEDLEETEVSTDISTPCLTINNEGDIPVGLTVEITGDDEKQVSLYSQNQNKKIELQNEEVIGNIVINTNIGQKSVTCKTLFLTQGETYTLDNSNYEGIESNIVFDGENYYGFSTRLDSIENKEYQALFKSADFVNWSQVGNEIEIASGRSYLGEYNRWQKLLYNDFDSTLYILCFNANYDGQDYTNVFSSVDGGINWTIEMKEEEYGDFCLNKKTQEIFFSEWCCVFNDITKEVAELPFQEGGRFYIHRESGTVEKDYTSEEGDFQNIFVDSKGNYILFHTSGLSQWFVFYVDCNGDLICKSENKVDGKNYIIETQDGFYGISDVPYITGNSYIDFSKNISDWERVQIFENKVLLYSSDKQQITYTENGELFKINETHNKINFLTSSSELNMQITKGKNIFVITSDGNIYVKIKYRQKYIGV